MKTKQFKKVLNMVLAYGLLILIACMTLGPFLWLVGTSLKSSGEAVYGYPPMMIPDQPTLHNYVRAMDAFPFVRYLMNSVIVSLIIVVCNLVFASLAAYPLSRFNFKGKHVVFILILSTMIVPFQLLMIPLYELCFKMNLQNSYIGLVIPHAITAFSIFLMRQAFIQIPKELDESAYMDGASTFQILVHILLPLVRPSLVTLTIFNFVAAWGDFLWPLIIVNDQNLYTLPLGVNKLNGIFVSDMRVISAGAILSILPMIVVFITLQKHFVKGATAGAIKG
ncbi:carbohydrate ABC transporter permease [Vallitalea pronyensis]|uniref:Carbohydrate ABC transporter permease n=1 Tax=Vallitalea pronyensis TaxID=1348613 RepID=A0A8J8SGV3_9FIRM|nr:carbohydrate ABC transporter permease [Vallitalea pronyensis]QUI22961.1 carbohydrate ABC transporter permease [Vallitalea pronyensis]